ncbi:hypothetical protein PVAP13_8KG080268 [Panicum virgatum]|uniref:Uncharacterized protein n=1 Tax=Panicum virgatum TaxID=38727 RepID=A0A8T0PHM1_PANVG|nr:hypothetical protein PVAP13_8KG080268 [Panicum virgatum]
MPFSMGSSCMWMRFSLGRHKVPAENLEYGTKTQVRSPHNVISRVSLALLRHQLAQAPPRRPHLAVSTHLPMIGFALRLRRQCWGQSLPTEPRCCGGRLASASAAAVWRGAGPEEGASGRPGSRSCRERRCRCRQRRLLLRGASLKSSSSLWRKVRMLLCLCKFVSKMSQEHG